MLTKFLRAERKFSTYWRKMKSINHDLKIKGIATPAISFTNDVDYYCSDFNTEDFSDLELMESNVVNFDSKKYSPGTDKKSTLDQDFDDEIVDMIKTNGKSIKY